MAKITERNTKATILKALREAEQKIAELEKGKLDAEQASKAKQAKKTIEQADQVIKGSVEDQISTLTKTISKQLAQVGEELVKEKTNLQTVKEAISLKETELKELYDIERQAHTLAALVNAHQELKLEQEKELAEAKEKATDELAQLQKQIDELRETYNELNQEEKAKFEQMKKRKEEEFAYQFAREQQKARDALNDELAAKRKAFAEEIEQKEKALAEQRKALQEQEDALAQREAKQAELEAEVKAIPDKIAEVKKAAEERANNKMKKTLAIKENAFKREIEADKRILEQERDNLRKQLETADQTIATLQEKLDQAYKRIQEMGIQMVSSSNESKTFDKIASLVGDKNNNNK